LANLSEDEAEAALVLRRCALISLGRAMNLDAQVHAEPTARCFVQQPERAHQGLRIVGSIIDFSEAAKDLCATDREWLVLRDELARRSSALEEYCEIRGTDHSLVKDDFAPRQLEGLAILAKQIAPFRADKIVFWGVEPAAGHQ